MVNSALTSGELDAPVDPEVALALAYARADARSRLRALWSLDARLAAVLRTTREPLVGRMRLTWWHDAVAEPEPLGGEPLLTALRAAALPPSGLQDVIEGWEALLDGEHEAALADYARGRGGALFALAGGVLETSDPVAAAGAGWALADLARHHSRPEVAERARRLAAVELDRAPWRWSRAARPLGMLAKLARRDLAYAEARGSPRRIAAMAWLALTGR